MPLVQLLSFLSIILFLNACAVVKRPVKRSTNFELLAFDSISAPPSPNYANIENWAAHPDKKDLSDNTPKPLKKYNLNKLPEADVFFVYPTIYTYQPHDMYHWNASTTDSIYNDKVAQSTIKFQASIFNQAGRVYAPFYRQAHYRSFKSPYIDGMNDGVKALLLAYSDVTKAFEYYIKHENDGRPFILAGHSQGSLHLKMLMQEYIDTTALQKQLICAYLPGWGITDTTFVNIPVCSADTSTNCFVSWRTFKRGYESDWGKSNEICTNPISWSNDTKIASHKLHEGSVLWKFNKVYRKLIDAEVHDSYLWIGKPRILGGRYIQKDNYHIGDLNIFYVNVRNNSILRTQQYLKHNNKATILKTVAE